MRFIPGVVARDVMRDQQFSGAVRDGVREVRDAQLPLPSRLGPVDAAVA